MIQGQKKVIQGRKKEVRLKKVIQGQKEIQGQKKVIQGRKKEVRLKKNDPRSKKRLALSYWPCGHIWPRQATSPSMMVRESSQPP